MSNNTNYFEKIGYRPRYEIGDRVFGHYQKIPFVGSVGNDRQINDSGPEVTIHLDLPIKTKDKIYSIIVVKHKDIRRLVEHEQETTGLRRNSKRGQRGV
jgi:hypothetical protein